MFLRGVSIVLSALCAVAAAGCAADPLEDERRESSAILMSAAPNDDTPGCSAAVGIDGEVVWAEARGVANMVTTAEFETTTPIHIASTSKQFTAIAVLMLAEQGDLSLDDALADHLDGMPAWAAQVTLDDLLHHTSGISDFMVLGPSNFGPPPITNADILEFVRESDRARLGMVGEFDYSNTNYTLLAEIVAEVTGTEFTEWMESTVFAPLALEVRFWPPIPSDAAGHHTSVDSFEVLETGPWIFVGPGGLITTPSELVRWGDHIRMSSLVSAETFENAVADAVRLDDAVAYGPGVAVFTGGALEHSGVDEGLLTEFAVSADRHTTVAISCNQGGIDIGRFHTDLKSLWFDEAAR